MLTTLCPGILPAPLPLFVRYCITKLDSWKENMGTVISEATCIPAWKMARGLVICLSLAYLMSIGGCGNKPNFPISPEIKLVDLSLNKGEGLLDSLILNLSYTDGDGDLGFNGLKQDSLPPYQFYASRDSLQANPRFFNIFVTHFFENAAGGYDTVPFTYAIRQNKRVLTSAGWWGRFPATQDMQSGEPIAGNLRYRMQDFWYARPGFGGYARVGKKFYLKFSIMDRAGRRSNVVTTPMYTVK